MIFLGQKKWPNEGVVRAIRIVAGLLAATVLAACGGGGNGPSVSSMSASPAMYGRTALWSVSGLSIDSASFHIASGSCDNLIEVAGGTSFQRQFTCRISSLGEVVGQVNDANGARLASLRVFIPEPVVRMTLAQGNIDLQLDPVAASVTVNNFLDYVNAGFYNNTIFHRVISNFVIQGGGYTPGTPNPVAKNPTRPPITLESNNGLTNVRGSLAMARSSDPNSATSQFYINVVDNPSLDYVSDQQPGYAVFGKVIAGLDVVDTIKDVPTQAIPSLGLTDVPVTNVIITSARQTQ